MNNKILRNGNFYLLLLFAFCVSVYPSVSYLLAAAIFLIWLLDFLIFRESEIFRLPLFYPLLGFNIFMGLAWIIAAIYGHPFPLIYVALLSLFYLIIPGIVTTLEQRQMVIWTFIAGAILITCLRLILWWGTYSNITQGLRPLSQPSLFMVVLAFSFLLGIYAESPSFREKLFTALVALPLVVVVIFSADRSALLLMLIAVFVIGILRDLTVFIPFAAAVLLIFSGAFGIDYYFEQTLAPATNDNFLANPIVEIRNNSEAVLSPSFFGEVAASKMLAQSAGIKKSFLINLLINAGPPALLLFLWVLFERAREAYFRRRRQLARQFKAYHLISLLTVVAIFIMNIYAAVFDFPVAILTCWLILGMSDI